jgi:hypothetical protein
MTERILYQETFTVGAGVDRFQIQQAMEDYRDPQLRLALVDDDVEGGHRITDTWPVDGNVIVEIGKKQPEGRIVTVTAIRTNTRPNRPNAPDVVAHAQGIANAIKQYWVPPKPFLGAPMREWSEYRYQMEKRNLPVESYEQMHIESGYQPKSLKTDYYEHKARRGDKK